MMENEEQHSLGFHLVLPLLMEAEDAAWRSGDHSVLVNGNTGGQVDTPDTLPNTILKHGSAVSNIHRYFSNLESRKCCLNLAACQTTVHCIRLIGNDLTDPVPDNDDSVTALPNAPLVDHLGEKDYAVYSQALLCADYPILCAPEPPPALSPMLPTSPRHALSVRRIPHDHDASLGVSIDTDDMVTSLVSTETLCDLLRQAFGLTRQKAARYERLIFEPYRKRKKSRHKVLVEELANQLALLENNKNPFYNQRHFLTPDAYKLWQHITRQHIGDLINKFWQDGVPRLKGSQHSDTHHNHENFRYLMEKLLMYETSMRGEDMRAVLSSSLSPASLRLLKEFGLRYGVGEVYRKTVYLAYLVDHFENEVWFLRRINNLLVAIVDIFPPNRNRVIMVREEWNLLKKSVGLLHGQCQNSLTKVKRLFPGESPQEGVECLIQLLTNTLELEACLLDKHHVPVVEFLMNYTQVNVANDYDHHRMVAMSDLKLDPFKPPTPKLVNRMISCIRDEVQDYAINYKHVYHSYFDVVLLAAQSFYRLLMDDVQRLLKEAHVMQSEGSFELRMLSLAYRLNHLDKDWKIYIPISEQSWRQMFQDEVMRWLDTLRSHGQQLLMQAIGADQFIGLNVDESDVRYSPRPPSSQSVSTCSITQSEGSAFDTVDHPSSPTYPDQNTGGSKEPSLRDWLTESMKLEENDTYLPKETAPFLSKTEGPFRRPRTRSDVVTETSFIVNEPMTSYISERKPSCLFTDHPTESSPPPVPVSQELGSSHEEDVFVTSDTLEKCEKMAENPKHKTESTSKREIYLEPKLEDCTDSSDTELGFKPEPEKSLVKSGSSSSSPKGFIGNLQPEMINEKRNRIGIQDEKSDDGYLATKIATQKKECVQDLDADIKTSIAKNLKISADSNVDSGEERPLEEGWKNLESERQQMNQPDPEDLEVSAIGENASSPIITCGREGASMFTPTFERTPISASLECHAKSLGTSVGEDAESILHISAITDTGMEEETGVVEGIPEPGYKNDTSSEAAASISIHKRRIVSEGDSENQKVKWDPSRRRLESCSPLPQDSLTESYLTLSGTVPVSGSLIDVVCLSRRVIAFGKVLSDTIYPIHLQDLQNPPECLLPQLKENDHSANVGPVVQCLLKARLAVYRKIIQTLSSLVCLYADNLLCYDFCGTTDKEARKIAGHQLIDRVKLAHQESRIWGCRHMALGLRRCDLHAGKKSRNLNQRYERISNEMALRINNLQSLYEAIPQVQAEANCVLDFTRMRDLALQLGLGEQDDLVEDFVIIDVVGQPPSPDIDFPGSETTGRPSTSSMESEATFDSDCSCNSETTLVFGHCKFHLRQVQEALVNLLAYRVNLFFRDYFSQCLRMELPMVVLQVRLQPLKTFLDWHLSTLKFWLYGNPYELFVNRLWRHTAQNFKSEVSKLTKNTKRPSVSPESVLQAIAYFMSYFRTKGLDESALTQEVEKTLYWLELHTCSTNHLVSLYRILFAHDADHIRNKSLPHLSVEFVQKMRTALHGESKCFTGSKFVNWVLTEGLNSHFTSDDEFGSNELLADIKVDENGAVELAQKLLDQGIIKTVEDDLPNTDHTPQPIPSHPYPNLSMSSYSLPRVRAARVMTVESLWDHHDISHSTPSPAFYRSESSSSDDSTVTSSGSSGGSQAGFYMVNSHDQTSENSAVDQNQDLHEEDHYHEQCNSLVRGSDTSTSGTPLSDVSGRFQPSPRSFYRFSSVCEETLLQQHVENPQSENLKTSDNVLDRNLLDRIVDMHKYYGVTSQLLLKFLAKRAMFDNQAKEFLKNHSEELNDEGNNWFSNSGGFFWCFRCR